MNNILYDLIINAGKVFCAKNKIDEPGSIAIKNGKIVKFDKKIEGKSNRVLDFPNGILLPGFIDLHTHPAPNSWKYGIDPDKYILPRGTTTIMSQGDAGANNWNTYKQNIIIPTKIDIYMALSPAINGEEFTQPVFKNLNDINYDLALETINQEPEYIWGLSVNVAQPCTYSHNPKDIMKRVLDIAENVNKPLLYGVRWDPFDWDISDQLNLLRNGDLVTYTFHVGPGGIAPNDKVEDSVWEAKDRGVKFDIGHGMSSFNFDIAERAISEGFLPDSISTDYYRRHIDADPIHDIPHVISKLIVSGMNYNDAFERATLSPAMILGLEDKIGTLSIDSLADIVVIEENKFTELFDVNGNKRVGKLLEPVLTIKNGELI
tara:strand:+ start:9677 stop:10804 length:1128 start_codon:yes stop_codon:yes gene_type:complete